MTKINNYELSSSSLPEEMIVQYTNGLLSALLLPIKYPLSEEKFNKIVRALPTVRLEENLQNFRAFGLTPTPEVPKNKKISMFCEKYMEYNAGLKYVANGIDGKQIEKVKVTKDILDSYFKSEDFLIRGKHSVQNFVKNYNLVLREHTNPLKSKHPNYYSVEHAKKLQIAELPDYWRHLSSLGLVAVKDRTGNLTDWVKKPS
ncbi:MAG TPA: hypothetical protein VK541_11340 [Pedobacter sp.]|uniref:hypothetical protein n=1 Tax=Pedobacter sp. TaxID=1411316 RepID=UPI002D0DC5AC|nr:hypothetical protein [Pedobacter sp.]HMI03069.1 hypothetical protein [Pedobacter sp.]